MRSVDTVSGMEDVNMDCPSSPCHMGSVSMPGSARFDEFASSIAICGVGLRLPGDICDTQSLWNTLRNRGDTRCQVPVSRYQIDGFSDSLGDKGSIQTQYGHYLTQDVSSFDPALFSISQAEAEKMDPQLRMLLEVVKECFENAGETSYRGSTVGCYVGTFGEDWLRSLSKDNQHSGGYVMVGQCDLMLANRVSFENDLQGPSMVIKTGCSSSLVAFHEACRAIKLGDCDGAIVAGTNLILGPDLTAEMTSAGILSPDGSCKTFDATANGYARAEAITAIYLQRVDRAVTKGLPIRAIVTNTGTNSDGRSQSLLQPNPAAQAQLIRKVHRDAKVDPLRTAFVECHGTGTSTGDPLETKAIGEVFSPRGVHIGSVKPNLGHSEGASGLTSVLKCIVMLENTMILPNIKFNIPNPHIDFDGLKLRVPKKLEAWPTDRDLRVGINSFGIGGSNAHILLEHPWLRMSQTQSIPKLIGDSCFHSQLLMFSGGTEKSLSVGIARHKQYIENRPSALYDLAHTLSHHREHHQYRAFAVCSGASDFEVSPILRVPRRKLDICMIFSGQGAQWALMGQDLLRQNPEFAADISQMDKVLKTLKHSPKWTIQDELTKPPESSRINHAEISQPLCTALQIALVRYLGRQGIHPDAVIGHSSGEIAAAFAAGFLSMEDAIIVAYYRGYVFSDSKFTSNGGMAAVGLGASELNPFLQEGVVVACENSPGSTTISGDKQTLRRVLENLQLALPDVAQRLLKVDVAYHSHLVRTAGVEYQKLLSAELGRTSHMPKLNGIPMYSSVTTERTDVRTTTTPEYWVNNLTSTVKFSGAVSTMMSSHPDHITLEIGPHSVLGAPLRQIYAAANTSLAYTSTLLRFTDARQCMLSCLGRMYQHGIVPELYRSTEPKKVLSDLPVYAWDHSATYWYESRLSKDWRSRKFGHHKLLGQRVLETSADVLVWRVMLDLEDLPWLSDHKIKRDVVYPFACYVLMATEALRQVTGQNGQSYLLRDIRVEKAMVLDSKKSLEVITTLVPCVSDGQKNRESFEVYISSYDGSNWTRHCRGRVEISTDAEQYRSPEVECTRKVPMDTWYTSLERLGLVFGPSFQLLKDAKVSPTDRSASACILDPQSNEGASDLPTAGVIDAIIQLPLLTVSRGLTRNMRNLMVPTSIKEIQIFPVHSGGQLTSSCSEVAGDMSVSCMSSDGKVCLRLTGLQLANLDGDPSSEFQDNHGAAHLEWVPDIRFQDAKRLIKSPLTPDCEKILLEEMAFLCISESLERLQGLELCTSHFRKYLRWLETIVRQASDGCHPKLQNAAFLSKLAGIERRALIKQHLDQLTTTTTMGAAAECINQVCQNVISICTGESDVLSLLTTENKLSKIYQSWTYDYGDFIQSLANQNPTLRILEVGAGTGGTTEGLLRRLNEQGEFRSYSSYTFTDVSAGFFPQAKERFAYATNVRYQVLDITRDPSKQGFELGQYDLIVAANVIHATPKLVETLKNLHALLAPNGQLLLSEACPGFGAFSFIFGTFPGWWLGEDDGRPQEPCVSVDRWQLELRNAGFSNDSDIVYDSDGAYPWCASIIARKKLNMQHSQDMITILSNDPNAQHCQSIVESLESEGRAWQILDFNDHQLVTGDCIVTVDLEAPFFKDLDEASFQSFKEICQNLGQYKLLWLMPPTQVNCTNPHGSQALGIIRTARSEMSISVITLEIPPKEATLGSVVIQIMKAPHDPQSESDLAQDMEYAFHNGCIHIGRYRPIQLEQSISVPIDTNTPVRDGTSQISVQLDSAATYLITGGFGGLGVSVSRWLIECGARNLVFLSRSAGQNQDHKDIAEEFDNMGCRLITVQGEVQNYSDVRRAIEAAPSPVRGVVHLAMVLRDAMLADLGFHDWNSVVDPKVQGAWNLHQLLGSSLDFFVMTSSIVTVSYQPGQSNYCAANTFLEAFCQYRHSQGLPASVISICPIEDVGVVANNRDIRSKLRAQGYWFVDEHALMQFMAVAISRSRPNTTLQNPSQSSEPWCNSSHLIMGLKSKLDLDNINNRLTWRRDRRMGTYHNVKGEKKVRLQSESEQIQTLLSDIADDPKQLSTRANMDLLSREIGRKLLAFLMRPDEDLSQATSLVHLGVDSLMAVELRRWWKQAFRLDISVIEIMKSNTLGDLATVTAGGLMRELQCAG